MKNEIFPAAALSAIILLWACSPMNMAVSEPLSSNNNAYAVKGRNGILIRQKLRFGEYHTEAVNRSWTKGTSNKAGFGIGVPGSSDYLDIISTEYIRKKQTLHYILSDGAGNKASAYCVSRFRANEIIIGNRPNSLFNILGDLSGLLGVSDSKYYVQLYMKENERPWQMVIDNQAAQIIPNSYSGLLSLDKDHYYTIVPVNRLEKNGKTGPSLAGSVGFEFRDREGRAVAAVSLIDNGRVFLGSSVMAEERLLLANACTALLLQQQIG